MIATQLNPAWLQRDPYIEFLNKAFPGSWNRAAFRWYLERRFCGAKPDILLRARGEEILAGVALAYRQVRVGCGLALNVGVLSAGGTLPAERGQGHYAQLLQAAIERGRERGLLALLGFVMHDNGSGRGLLRLGARAIPSFYLSGGARGWRLKRGRADHLEGGDDAGRDALRATPTRRDARSESRACFHYEQPADWRQQFLQRPYAVHIRRLDRDSEAFIEQVGDTDRLQRLDCPAWKTRAHLAALAAASASSGRRFFSYSLDAQLAAVARRRGLRVRRGFFMLLPLQPRNAHWQSLHTASWDVHCGDRL